MATISLDRNPSLRLGHQNGVVIEEIDGLIKVYKNGHVERTQIVPIVSTSLPPEIGVTSGDVTIDKFTNIWVRFYVPKSDHHGKGKFPLLVYFHGGGFCVGSAAWSCYHEFLAKLSSKAGCVIMSVNYRLAPENPLPSAYEDGYKSLIWLKQQTITGTKEWWWRQCDFSAVYLAGDSAGGNIAYNVATGLHGGSSLNFKGVILIQPFFGGEIRTKSEKLMAQPPLSALSLAAADTYWRLALPGGANRDHLWCNPMGKGFEEKLGNLKYLPIMVCVSELDILKDRNMEFCDGLASVAKKVECVVYKGVGHAFQVLSKSQISQIRTQEMMGHIKTFISR